AKGSVSSNELDVSPKGLLSKPPPKPLSALVDDPPKGVFAAGLLALLSAAELKSKSSKGVALLWPFVGGANGPEPTFGGGGGGDASKPWAALSKSKSASLPVVNGPLVGLKSDVNGSVELAGFAPGKERPLTQSSYSAEDGSLTSLPLP